MTRSNSTKAVIALCVVMIALVFLSRPSTPSSTPSSDPYFSLVQSGSMLPSDSQCSSAAGHDTFEPRPENAEPNGTTPSASD
ncbi:MAG: hypothetical protein WBQ86_16380, partial [Candidatus Binatus sp.]